MKEKIISKKTVYTAKRFFVEEADIDFGNDKRSTFQRIIFSTGGGVFAVPIDKDGYVYFVEHYVFGIDKILMYLPTGAREKGLKDQVVMQHELMEEIGMKAGKIVKLGELLDNPSYEDNKVVCFLALDLLPSGRKGDEEMDVKIKKIKFVRALEMVKSNKITDQRSVAGILLANEYIKKHKIKL